MNKFKGLYNKLVYPVPGSSGDLKLMLVYNVLWFEMHMAQIIEK